jgi:hypothetical protein
MVHGTLTLIEHPFQRWNLCICLPRPIALREGTSIRNAPTNFHGTCVNPGFMPDSTEPREESTETLMKETAIHPLS